MDVHKHSLTAVAVDELGRTVAEQSGPVDEQVAVWAGSLDGQRLWAVEDCRHVTRGPERSLVEAGRARRLRPGWGGGEKPARAGLSPGAKRSGQAMS